MYKRKTRDWWGLYYDYGYGDGLELISACYSYKEAIEDRKAYIKNEGIVPRIKKHRERIEEGVDQNEPQI